MNSKNLMPPHPLHNLFIDFSKASTEAIEKILDALNAEVDEAVAQKRIPVLEKAFARLSPTSPVMN